MQSLLALLAAGMIAAAGLDPAFAQGQAAPAPKTTTKKPPAAPNDESPTAAKTAVGTVKATAPDNVVVVGKVKGQETEWTFAVDGTTKVRKASQDVTAAELRPGDPVRVRYLEQDGRTVAQHIAVTTPAKAKSEPAPPGKK